MENATSQPEPLLDELLSDPIVQLLMKTDGVQEQELRPLINQLTESMNARAKPAN